MEGVWPVIALRSPEVWSRCHLEDETRHVDHSIRDDEEYGGNGSYGVKAMKEQKHL